MKISMQLKVVANWIIWSNINLIFFFSLYSWTKYIAAIVAKILQSHDINCSIIFLSAIGREHQERYIKKTCMSRKMKCKRSHVHSIWTFFLCAPLTYRPSINQAVAKGFIFGLFFCSHIFCVTALNARTWDGRYWNRFKKTFKWWKIGNFNRNYA